MMKKVVMVVPSFSAKGGISSVVNGYRGSELEKKYKIKYIESYCDGSKAKKICKAIEAYFLFFKEMTINKPNLVHSEQQKAVYWIKHFLEKGDMSANEIYCRLDNEGISKRVARMVKTEMGIHCYQKKRKWYWSVQPEEGVMNGPQV